jgi:hypothetical protein
MGFPRAPFFGNNNIQEVGKSQDRGGKMAEEKKTKEAEEAPAGKSGQEQEESAPEEKMTEGAVKPSEEPVAETAAGAEAPEPEGELESQAAEEGKDAAAKMAELKKPLEKMTAKELRDVALGISGITGVHAMKKEDLLTTIKTAWGIEAEKAPKEKKEEKARVSVAVLKAKIQEVKIKRAEALQKKDKRMARIYRRMINRLKKRSRRAA